jgi:uridylate kinase
MYKRILLKMSGEALKGANEFGIDPKTVKQVAEQIKLVHDLGIEIGIVCGGGNIFRGHIGQELGMDRAQADYMGMLATVMNGLAVQDALEALGVPTRVMSALSIDDVCEPYIRRRATRHLEKGRVCIFAGGTGMPYFSTDTAAALRATEIGAEVILMAKNGVAGVYSADPKVNKDAILYSQITYIDVIQQQLKVMDTTAVSLCMDNNIDIVVFNMSDTSNLIRVINGEKIGTTIRKEF